MGVNSSSLTRRKRNVRSPLRGERRVTCVSIIGGGAPSRPAIAVVRSCSTVPIDSPTAAIFHERWTLGKTE